jgi:hypothetical protein
MKISNKIVDYSIAFILYFEGYYALVHSKVPNAESLWLAIVLYSMGQTIQNNIKDD